VKKMKEKKIFRFKAANEAYREEAGEWAHRRKAEMESKRKQYAVT
jgi:hypothetical protein